MIDEEDYGKIIEAHAHIGTWCADNADFTEETLNNVMGEPFTVSINGEEEENEVVAVMVSNMSGIDLKPPKSPKTKPTPKCWTSRAKTRNSNR